MKIKEIHKKYKDLGIDLKKDINLNIDAHQDNKTGELDYNSYVTAQEKANVEKINNSGPDYNRIVMISKYIKEHIPNLKFGICHGTRRGTEQRDFKNILNIPVVGTEISHTAEQFPDTIRWDFHEIKNEWINNVCFIFSNSLDHSYDPIYCLSQWMKCIKPGGKIFLQRENDELSEQRSRARQKSGYPNADIFQIKDEEFFKIVEAAGQKEWVLKKPNKLKIKSNKRIVALERKE